MQITQRFKAGNVHPGSWWLLALALATCASALTSIAEISGLIAAIVIVMLLARENRPWAQSLRFYLVTGLIVVLIRILFRIIFNFDSSENVAITLPQIRVDLGAVGQVDLFGRVSVTTLATALRDGLRMAAIILSVGLANTLANPRRLLKNTPGALYEVATAMVIAINMAPQIIVSAKRVRSARELRGRSRRQNILSGLLIPVLEDTLESSMALAATMDARGFGRSGSLTKSQRRVSRAATLLAISCLAIGSYLLLSGTNLAGPLISFTFGFLSLLAALRLGNLRHLKTSYRPAPWRVQDWIILIGAAGLVSLAIVGVVR